MTGKSHGQRSLEGYSPRGHETVRLDLATKQQQQEWLRTQREEIQEFPKIFITLIKTFSVGFPDGLGRLRIYRPKPGTWVQSLVGKIPHATEQLSLSATTTEALVLDSLCPTAREAAERRGPCTATKSGHPPCS